ncbi:hypothetical protein NDN08_004591 [Rhodosorus marinus]|uniref:Uncharacterized protein n=1 Tax=Rhodosorus marinus TaxID=101924 RepID=A0AAV8ULN7_9RHOD|nr:hypothetical protein NDN08_004591 [Rhodosorus marinus]
MEKLETDPSKIRAGSYLKAIAWMITPNYMEPMYKAMGDSMHKQRKLLKVEAAAAGAERGAEAAVQEDTK